MKVVVPIKQILDPTGFVVNRRRERIFVNREDYIINPNDKNALEAALQLKDADESVEVIAVSLGLARADDALREALAMGADAAYLLSDDTLAGVDARGAALALAAAVRKIGDVALVVTGSVALDTGGGQMAPRLAEALGWPQVTGVWGFVVDDGTLRAKRAWGDGYLEVETALPAVLAVLPEANKPRYPHGGRIMDAYREMEVTVWDTEALGLSPGELAPLVTERGQAFPPPRTFGELITGAPEEAARELVSHLRVQKILGDW